MGILGAEDEVWHWLELVVWVKCLTGCSATVELYMWKCICLQLKSLMTWCLNETRIIVCLNSSLSDSTCVAS
jgi:hypothetical protein